MRYRCGVHQCVYVAETNIDEFVVCVLHDAPQVRRLLERFEQPASFWKDERPIVLPVGPLQVEHFEKLEAPDDAVFAWQDERLAQVPDTPSTTIHPHFDLTRKELP